MISHALRFVLAGGIALVLLAGDVRADKLVVPSDAWPTIQSAVDGALPGDVIVVAGGKYAENVVISGASDLVLRGKGGARITAGDGVGIRVEQSVGVTLRNLIVKDGSADGIAVEDCSEVRVVLCAVRAVDGDGIRVEGGTLNRVDKNFVRDVGGSAIVLTSAGGDGDGDAQRVASVARNRIVAPGRDGVRVAGDEHVVRKNRVLDAGRDAFAVEQGDTGTGNVFRSNVALRPERWGLLADGLGSTFARNRVRDSVLAGGAVFGADHVVRKNRIDRAGGAALFVGGATNTLHHNKLIKAADRGVLVEGDGNTLRKNLIIASGADGIEVTSAGNTFVRNVVAGSGGLDINDALAGAGLNVYVKNVFGTSNLP